MGGPYFWPQFWGFVAFLVVAFPAWLFTKRDRLIDTHRGDTIAIEALPTYRSFTPGTYHAMLVRQSGNVYRDLGVFRSARAALDEAVKALRRANIARVRITHTSDTELAAYRDHYSLTGRAEGKKMAGLRLVMVEAYPVMPTAVAPVAPSAPVPAMMVVEPRPITSFHQTTASGLLITLVDAIKGEGNQHKLLVQYTCTHCGSEDPAAPTGLQIEQVKCPACGAQFEHLGDVQAIQRGLLKQYLAGTGLDVASINGVGR